MEEQQLWELLGKKITGEANAAELETLNRLLEKYPEALYTSEAMASYWRTHQEKADLLQRESALERHLQRLAEASRDEGVAEGAGAGESYRPGEGCVPEAGDGMGSDTDDDRKDGPRRWGVYRRMLAGAATVAAVLTGCLLLIPALQKKGSKSPAIRQMAVTTPGERRQVELPDGSTAWLNAGTTLEYIQRPGVDSQREVSLSGEACFSIKHDAKHPFLVRTSRMDIRDLGTSFNVKAYPQDRTTEATLLEGMIDVRVNKGKEGMVLARPHQKFTLFARPEGEESPSHPEGLEGPSPEGEEGPSHPDSGSSAAATGKKTETSIYQVSTVTVNHPDSLLAETAWMKNMLVFRDESFEELAVKLERWYDVTIRFSDTERVHYRFTGVLADESLAQALQVLQMMKPFHFTISGKTVRIGK